MKIFDLDNVENLKDGAVLTEVDFPSFTTPNKAPISTVSPSFALIDDKVPDKGDGTSTFTLSVSSSTNGSSDLTCSPTCLSHLDTVASVTDSPKDGTKIWFDMPS